MEMAKEREARITIAKTHTAARGRCSGGCRRSRALTFLLTLSNTNSRRPAAGILACAGVREHSLSCILSLSHTHGGPRQVFRLVQVFESGEKQDAEKLAKEIDGLDGGRNVDGQAVKT